MHLAHSFVLPLYSPLAPAIEDVVRSGKKGKLENPLHLSVSSLIDLDH